VGVIICIYDICIHQFGMDSPPSKTWRNPDHGGTNGFYMCEHKAIYPISTDAAFTLGYSSFMTSLTSEVTTLKNGQSTENDAVNGIDLGTDQCNKDHPHDVEHLESCATRSLHGRFNNIDTYGCLV
jgi:hypothetical protein